MFGRLFGHQLRFGQTFSPEDNGAPSNGNAKETVRPLPGSILFVCGMNTIRSPMAEHLAKEILGNRAFIRSAGVHEGHEDGFMQAVMAERGIPLADHTPITLDELEDDYFDLIITLSPEAHHRALELTRSDAVEVEYWPTADPSTVAGRREQVVEAYRQTRDALEKRIRQRFTS